MTSPSPNRRFSSTPGWLVILSLAVTGILFLSERFQWFGFNSHKGWTVLIAVAGVVAFLVLMLLWLAVALVFRLGFQFSIRSLLVLVVAVALPFSWLGVEMKRAREQNQAVEGIGRLGILVTYDWEILNVPIVQEPEWLRNFLGCDFFDDVANARPDYSALDSGESVAMSDATLEFLKGFTHLRYLYFGNTRITDAGLECIRGFREITVLDLTGEQVTDSGLKNIEGLTSLEELWLGSSITNVGFQHLRKLTNLRKLYICGSQVTVDEVADLRKALPDCEIGPPPRILGGGGGFMGTL